MVVLKSTAKSLMRGYFFGFVKPTSPNFALYPKLLGPSLDAYGGKVLCKQDIKDASYSEDADEWTAMVVLQFPSVAQAVTWHDSEEYAEAKALRLETSTGQFAIIEGPDFGNYHGFLGAFIKVNDPVAFAKYAPTKTLGAYEARRTYNKVDDLPYAEGLENYDAAVLIAFPQRMGGTGWMTSTEYKPDRDLRLSTTSGPCAIIGTDE